MKNAQLIPTPGAGIFASIMAVICLLTPLLAIIVGASTPFLEYGIEHVILCLFAIIIVVSLSLGFYFETKEKVKASYYFVNQQGNLKVRIWKLLPWVLLLSAVLLLTFCSILAYVRSVLTEVN